jgi:hypothetical protein
LVQGRFWQLTPFSSKVVSMISLLVTKWSMRYMFKIGGLLMQKEIQVKLKFPCGETLIGVHIKSLTRCFRSPKS